MTLGSIRTWLVPNFWIISEVSQRFIGFSRILQKGSCFINSSGFQELLWFLLGLGTSLLYSIRVFIEIHWIFKDIATRFMLHKQYQFLGITMGSLRLVATFLDSIKGIIENCVMEFQGLPISCTRFRMFHFQGYYNKVHTSNTVDLRNDFGFQQNLSHVQG